MGNRKLLKCQARFQNNSLCSTRNSTDEIAEIPLCSNSLCISSLSVCVALVFRYDADTAFDSFCVAFVCCCDNDNAWLCIRFLISRYRINGLKYGHKITLWKVRHTGSENFFFSPPNFINDINLAVDSDIFFGGGGGGGPSFIISPSSRSWSSVSPKSLAVGVVIDCFMESALCTVSLLFADSCCNSCDSLLGGFLSISPISSIE
mmetsp:Transcript_12428/g.19794  ORF Transcript_12428/g.19794 Transcript_12428/m.19794 type:complete len:205 (-) Transcript_12428:515-1129(-)